MSESEEKGQIPALVPRNDALVPLQDPQPQIVEELVRRASGSSPQYLDQAIADARQHEELADEVIGRATKDIRKVEAIVKQKDDEVATRNFRTQIYASVVAVVAISAGLLGNILGAAIAGTLGAIIRAEGAAGAYIWHRRKKKIQLLVEEASVQRQRWLDHKRNLALARSKMEGIKSERR